MSTQQDHQMPDQQTTADTTELDPDSLAAIRTLLATEPEVTSSSHDVQKGDKAVNADAEVADQAKAQQRRAIEPNVPETRAERRTTGRASLPPLADPEKPAARKAKARQASGLRVRLEAQFAHQKARVLGYRPTPRHIVLGCLFLVVFFRPWLVLGIVFLTLFILLGIFLILGYDGFWRRAMGLGRWYARRRPEQSAQLHGKLDRFAMKWDAVLDRFPEGTVDGLYLPDFGDLAAAEARHDEALDRRFNTLRETEV